ncbi:rhomboid family intramembrane serine protease [Pyxidicoccus xibeiensis]|uniref:rhomboid family intramembrane serine protease n=1 Tax=Pyxidicoccus xibeiensis TaxID=2906759 RepID=UPI0020A77A5F|nr:rhomboid family intramembrane serine protease [Pyxidicoccus xibeiensis]MCP3136524.1 rhomboid family intramembrane serine protease [Pyxidicoccus xibeiensis]
MSTPQPSEPPSPEVPVEGESFAAHLARRLEAEQGFTPGTFPEAAELLEASDAVLTYSDGMSAVIVCLVDRERDGARRFGLDVAALERIGKACLKYTGSVTGTKLPLGLQVLEVGRAPATEEDRKRLESLRLGVFHKVHLHAMHVDVATGEVWANTWRRAKVSARYVRRVLSEPRVIREEEPLVEPPERKPVLTSLLLAAVALGFAAEHVFAVGEGGAGPLAPGVRTLVAMGGVNSGLVLEAGQWWRLLMAPLLHGDVFHLVLNGFLLWFVMATVEGMVGRAWTGLLLLVGALGGGALSMLINADTVVSVGASGVLMGLLGALLALSRRVPPGPERTQLQMLSVQLLVPSLIPIGMSRTGAEIDFAAHLGGALAGGAVGLLLARVWPRSEAIPPATRPVGAVSVLSAVALIVSVGFAHDSWQDSRLQLELIPNEALPKTHEDGMKQVQELMERYPRDPRTHLFQAMVMMDAQDLPGAERELRTALSEQRILEHFFEGTELPLVLHTELGRVLVEQERTEEARTLVAPYCAAGEGGKVPPGLAELGLCGTVP